MIRIEMTHETGERRIGALREVIRRIGRRAYQVRLALAIPAALIIASLTLRHSQQWVDWLCWGSVMAYLPVSVFMAVWLARCRREARRLLADLTREEQREVLSPLKDDLRDETRNIVGPLLRQTRGGSPSPAAPPEGRGDEPAAT
jgi:hypothetical protein